jgi:molybdopterin-containing oxidoreductase family iron-sulfur binding subunit
MSHRHHLDLLANHPEANPGAPALTRRGFLRGVAAGVGSASAFACTRAPAQKIVPYRQQPEELIPGRPLHYASAFTLDGYATGILVESHEGRPTKIEGNPSHPASLGASGSFEQATLMDLYSPRRLRGARKNRAPASGTALLDDLALSADPARRGRGIHLVLPPTSSPLLSARLIALQSRLPELALYFHSAISRVRAWQGARDAFGRVLEVRANLRRAQVVLALDADFLASGPDWLALAKQFADGRRVASRSDTVNRLYAVTGVPSVTGDSADHRLALGDRELPTFVARLLVAVARELPELSPPDLAQRLARTRALAPAAEHFLAALARDLLAARGACAVLVGPRQPASVHAAVHALNALLGGEHGPVRYAPSAVLDAGTARHDALPELCAALEADAVEHVVVCDVDVTRTCYGDLPLRAAFAKAKQSTYLGLFDQETARVCGSLLPALHVLESWADTRALDGTTSLVQPLIAPLYDGYDALAVVQALAREPVRPSHDVLRGFWQAQRPNDFEARWVGSLASGIVAESEIPSVSAPALSWGFVERLAADAAHKGELLELMVHADPQLYDGRFIDNPWLLELPSPTSKLSWGNAVQLAPETAAELAVNNGDVLALSANGKTVEAPALLSPGHAPRALSLTLGWGQSGELLGAAQGANAFPLTSADSPWSTSIACHKTGRREELALAQESFELGTVADEIFASVTFAEYRAGAKLADKLREPQPSLYASDAPAAPRQWGMAIDLGVCTGCSACVLACQAENSIPTVGKAGVLKHRAMHWLRVDRYVTRAEHGERVRVQPMACQHCEKAPCEYVCPTAATVHSTDGLNQMVYNRCVGTRYCSNNCPYKVRRFNWFDYHESERSPLELSHNPNVTVRERGVMEKCSYCVQRIRAHEIAEKTGQTRIRPLVTACEQACPTRAITFGDTRDESAPVAQLHASERAFSALATLGTVPRTRYLARLANPNPELE